MITRRLGLARSWAVGVAPTRVLAAFISMVLVLVLVLIGTVVVPASGATAAPGQVEAGLMRLAGQSSVVEPDGELVLRVRTTGAPPGAQLAVSVHNRVLTRSEFVRTLEGEGLRSRLGSASATPLDELDADGSGTVQRSIPIRTGTGDGSRVRVPSEGVYPVVVELLDEDGNRIDNLVTHMVRLPERGSAAPPLDVALVLPLDGPPALRPDGSTELDATARDGIVTTISALLNHPDVDLSIDATPETVAALARDASPDDASVLDSLRGALARHQVLARPFVDLDVAAWLEAGLEPALAAQFDRGAAVLDDLVGRADAGTWVASSTFDTPSAAWIRDRGIGELVIPEPALTALDDRQFPVALTQTFDVAGVDGVRAAVADAGLTARFAATGDPVLDAHRLLADLSVVFYDEPTSRRGVVVVPPEGWTPPAEFLDALLAGLVDAAAVLRPVDLATFFTGVPRADADGGTIDESDGATGSEIPADRPLTRTLTPGPSTELGPLPGQLQGATGAIATYVSVIGSGSPRADPFVERVMVAGAADLAGSGRAAYFDAVEADIDAELARIVPPARQTITLTDRDGQVPLVFRNDTGYPVSFVARLEADKLEFPELPAGVLRLTLTDETTRVEVKVRARTSGDSPLDVIVVTPDGRRELGRSRFTVRSTAVSGVGLVLSIGAGTFLLVWWARDIRSRRRRTKQDGTAPAARVRRRRHDPVAPHPVR